jgi:hypothetical protein
VEIGKEISEMRIAFYVLTISLAVMYVGNVYAQDGLVLYLSFDDVDGDKVRDGSGYQNDGTMLGGAEIVDGRMGKAIKIDGSTGHVEVSNSDSLNIGMKSLTIECWLNTSSSDRQTYSRIVSKGNFSWTPGYIFQLYSQGQPAISISDQSKVAIYAAAKGAAVNDGKWHHIAGVVDRENNEVRIYIDGQPQEIELPLGMAVTDPRDIGDITCDNKLAFGSDDQQVRELVEGLYDEFRIWNRALTDVEIQQAAIGEIPSAAEFRGKMPTVWARLKSR